ncbi:MAG: hypothetical protein QOF84_4638, partial [Streptomyces sp.]|nr:hypothetical protein [Streptomyces sp.]
PAGTTFTFCKIFGRPRRTEWDEAE